MTVTQMLDELLGRVSVAEPTRMTEPYMVKMYNELDAKFGYDPGPQTYMFGLDPAVAKSIARHKNKTSPNFIYYFAEEEPHRWW